MPGIIYVLTNEAMPGLVKIGKTTQENPVVRMDQLYSTGVPVPFECAIAMRVESPDAVEKALHIAFGPSRINPRREFFKIGAEQAIAIIKQMGLEDVTPQVTAENQTISKEERASSQRLKTRRPTQNFKEMGIPVGAVLVSIETGKEAEVVDDRRVRFEGDVTYLTKATAIVLELDHSVAPARHWTYEGRSLLDIYNETYPLQDS